MDQLWFLDRCRLTEFNKSVNQLGNIFRGICRISIFLVLVSIFLAHAFFIHWTTKDPDLRMFKFSENGTRYCGLMLRFMGLKYKAVNFPKADEKFLLVSNHMGFVDILVMASMMPMIFVTSMEMRETPFLGLLTEMGGCMYVERRSRSQILDELKNIITGLKKGFRVVLYPEATSTNGEQVLPFKKTLMMAAAHAGVPIQPVVINYREINGEPFSLKNRDHVCWYGDITFVSSMWKSMIVKSVTAEVEFLEKIYPKIDDDRSLIAEKAHSLISAKFVPARPVLET